MAELAERTSDGRVRLNLHPGQAAAWNSTKRFVAVIAGTQGGKTSFGPHWLHREIKNCGPGDYLVVTPTFQLLERKALPEMLRLFEKWLQLGRYVVSPSRKFIFNEEGEKKTFGRRFPDTPTTVWFGYAEDPESLESMTAKAAWLDECGQKKFKVESWEAIIRRLSLETARGGGRALLTTTPYDLGWLKQVIYDRWRAGSDDREVIRFDSTMNPSFPLEEYERARREMPKWRFDMFYRAIFTKPAGMIYDCFLDEYWPRGHKCRPFTIPRHWPRYVGLDFGGVNTAAVFFAQELAASEDDASSAETPTGRFFLYREYLAGSRTAAEHARALRQGEPRDLFCVGGSKSEGQWRREFKQAGLTILPPPIKDVEVGIDRVYAAHRLNTIVVFDNCQSYLAQKMSYSRVVDPNTGTPTEDIEDKDTYHFMDAERYIVAKLRSYEENQIKRTPKAKRARYAYV